jgi:hypothetical protein
MDDDLQPELTIVHHNAILDILSRIVKAVSRFLYVSLGPDATSFASQLSSMHTQVQLNRLASHCHRLLTLHMIVVDYKSRIVRQVTIMVGIFYTTSSSPRATNNCH